MLAFNEILVKRLPDEKRITRKVDNFAYNGYTIVPVKCQIDSILQSGVSGLMSIVVDVDPAEIELEVRPSTSRGHLLVIISKRLPR